MFRVSVSSRLEIKWRISQGRPVGFKPQEGWCETEITACSECWLWRFALLPSDNCISLLSAALMVQNLLWNYSKRWIFHFFIVVLADLWCFSVRWHSFFPPMMAITAGPFLCVCLYLVWIFVYCVCVREGESDEHPPLWLHPLCQETSHTDVFAQQIEAATQRNAHSVMPRIDAKLSLTNAGVCVSARHSSVSMLILTWHSLHSPGVLLFLDTDWRCVSSSGSGTPGLSWFVLEPQQTLCVYVWETC